MTSVSYEDYVVKRDGRQETVSFDKILTRCKNLSNNELNINLTSLVQKIIDGLYNGISTTEIDELLAQQCASLSTVHPDYELLASRILISNHHKNTDENYLNVVEKLYHYKDIHNVHSPIISEQLYNIVKNNHKLVQNMLMFENDYNLDYFGFKTLERAYLMKINGVIVERPQHMFMRVSIGIHGDDFSKVKQTYGYMSMLYFTHATPTLFNAGTPRPQCSSCYLQAMESDSIEGIYNTLSDVASISKWAGGIGLHISNVRSSGSHIRGTNGTSNGIVPMLKVFNSTARYVDQGGGKRSGSFAIYLEPWHGDVETFLEMKKNHGDENERARDLFYALWVPDLFMERIQVDGNWTLMCPDKCPGLSDCYGDDFNNLYEKYERKNMGEKTIKARELWYKILDSQIETGNPYLLYKDACNMKSNQQNLGTIKSSNLCTEIIEYSDKDETAVCNLASIALSKCINYPDLKHLNNLILYTKNDCNWCVLIKGLLNKYNLNYHEINLSNDNIKKFFSDYGVSTLPQLFNNDFLIGGYDNTVKMISPTFDHVMLHQLTQILTENLNRVIDINFYPTKKTRTSNMRHRPIGLGVQGLADTFAILNIPFHSEEARQLNKDIFETIYHGALDKSLELSIKNGPYSTFKGSPASNGKLQFDLWGVTPSDRYDWGKLRKTIMEHGLRNSLLVAPMPTASTSQILGNNECFEPFTSNIYVRRTIAGEFIRANKYLIRDLITMNLWNENIKNQIIADNGSIQNILGIPKKTKEIYKTVWEIPMKHIIELAADRGAYICQSQSTNLWMKNPSIQKLTSMHFFSWKKGLKTGIYYLRTKAKAAPQQFTIEPTKQKETIQEEEEEECLMCGS